MKFILMFLLIPTMALGTVTTGVFTKPKPVKLEEPKESKEEKKERLEEICEQLLEEGEPDIIAAGFHVRVGKGAEWIIDNLNKPYGWSFTGYSSLKINEKGSRSRWKIGMINGELDWSTYDELDQRGRHVEQNYQLLEEWNQRRSREAVFGVCFIKEF